MQFKFGRTVQPWPFTQAVGHKSSPTAPSTPGGGRQRKGFFVMGILKLLLCLSSAVSMRHGLRMRTIPGCSLTSAALRLLRLDSAVQASARKRHKTSFNVSSAGKREAG